MTNHSIQETAIGGDTYSLLNFHQAFLIWNAVRTELSWTYNRSQHLLERQGKTEC